MRAYVPEHVPLNAESFPLLVKVRPEGLDAETRRRLRLPGFSLSVTQTETVRYVPPARSCIQKLTASAAPPSPAPLPQPTPSLQHPPSRPRNHSSTAEATRASTSAGSHFAHPPARPRRVRTAYFPRTSRVHSSSAARTPPTRPSPTRASTTRRTRARACACALTYRSAVSCGTGKQARRRQSKSCARPARGRSGACGTR